MSKANYLHTLFEDQVLKTPMSVALVEHEGKSITYDELNRNANKLSHYIMQRVQTTNTVIAVVSDRNICLVTILLAILKSGNSFLVLEDTLPIERSLYMLEDSKASLLIAEKDLLTIKYKEYTGKTFIVDNEILEKNSTCNPVVDLDPLISVAYIIYTSGSTGNPKGVMGTHAGMVNRCKYMWKRFPYNENEICCLKTVLTFIDYVSEIFTPLLQGVPVHLLNSTAVSNIDMLVEKLEAARVTRIICVPSILRTMISLFGTLEHKLPYLKHWEVTGEAVSLETVKDFFDSYPSANLYNMYGSSEVTGDLMTHKITLEDVTSGIIPIGRPVDNVDLYIINEQGELADEGELCTSGIALSLGYLFKPELTAEKFLPNPFNTSDQANFSSKMMYRLGDWVKRRDDGTILYLGRRDHQVKIRGIRVELLEIETLIQRYPGVKQAVLKYWKKSDSYGILVAYIVVQSDSSMCESGLTAFLKAKIPHYMIPNHYITLEALPLNGNGKVNRLVLPEPKLEGDMTETYKDDIEKFLCETIAKEIGLNHVSPIDPLDHLGLSSLVLARIRNIIKKHYTGLEISIYDTLVSLKVRDLAALMRERLESGDLHESTDVYSVEDEFVPNLEKILSEFTLKYGYTDDETGVTYSTIKESDVPNAARAMTVLFGKENAVQNSLGFSEEQSDEFFAYILKHTLGQDLTVVAKLNGNIIGLDISFDYVHVIYVFASVKKFLVRQGFYEKNRPLDEIVLALYDSFNPSAEPGDIVHQTYSAVDVKYSNLGVGRVLNKLSHKIAVSLGYSEAVTELSSMYSIANAKDDGFVFEKEINIDSFVDSRSHRPFKGIPGSMILARLSYST